MQLPEPAPTSYFAQKPMQPVTGDSTERSMSPKHQKVKEYYLLEHFINDPFMYLIKVFLIVFFTIVYGNEFKKH